jgi:hypothetical protein
MEKPCRPGWSTTRDDLTNKFPRRQKICPDFSPPGTNSLTECPAETHIPWFFGSVNRTPRQPGRKETFSVRLLLKEGRERGPSQKRAETNDEPDQHPEECQMIEVMQTMLIVSGLIFLILALCGAGREETDEDHSTRPAAHLHLRQGSLAGRRALRQECLPHVHGHLP